MTDKQIIIDGIDVSGCVNLRLETNTAETSYYNACSIGLWQRWYSNLEPSCQMSCHCKNNKDCYYRQLKRKEQECEELKAKCKKYGEINKQETKDYAELKADREEALKQLEFVRTLNTVREAEIRKYSKTLTEIKEIAEVEIECKTYEIEHDCFNETRCKALNEHIDFTEQILQKISEVLE